MVRAEPATELRVSFFQPMGKPATGVHLWPKLLVLPNQVRPRFISLPPSVAERYKALAGSGGEVVIKGLPQGYLVRLAHDSPDYAKLTYEQQFTLAKAPVTEIAPQRFAQSGSLSGKVSIASTGEPVAGVKVNTQEAHDGQGGGGNGWGDAVTDKDGNFTLGQLSPGNYNLNVLLAGQMDKDWTSVAHDSTPVKAGEKRTGLDIKLIKGGLIVGTVKFSDGKPIPGIHVGVYGPARPRSGAWVQNTLTDKTGKYVLRVPAGANHVYLQGGPMLGYGPRDSMPEDVTVEDGKEIKIDFTVPR